MARTITLTRAVPAFRAGTAPFHPALRAHVRGLYGLSGNIPDTVVAEMHRIASEVGKASVDAWNAVKDADTWAQSKWREALGTESTFEAGKAFAAAQSTLAAETKARVDRVLAADDIVQAAAFLSDSRYGNWTDIAVQQEALRLASIGGAAAEISRGMAKDAAGVASGFGQGVLNVVKYLPYIAVGGVLLWGGLFVWRLTRAAKFAAPSLTPRENAPAVAGYSARRRRRRRSHR